MRILSWLQPTRASPRERKTSMAVANALQNDVVSSPVANVANVANVATAEDLATRQVNVANVITQVRVITAPAAFETTQLPKRRRVLRCS